MPTHIAASLAISVSITAPLGDLVALPLKETQALRIQEYFYRVTVGRWIAWIALLPQHPLHLFYTSIYHDYSQGRKRNFRTSFHRLICSKRSCSVGN